MSEKDIVPISEKSITKIPVEVLHTFRNKHPIQSVARQFRITHTFIQIDSLVRYAILTMIRAGYYRQREFTTTYSRRKCFDQNPAFTGHQDRFYAEDHLPIWSEIQISPLTKRQHERSLLLSVQQLGLSTGELQLWLEVQFKDAIEQLHHITKENERLYEEWIDKWVEDNREEFEAKEWSRGTEGYRAWAKYCFKNAPADYQKERQPYDDPDSPYFGYSDWYNWRDYLPYWFMKAGTIDSEWQSRVLYTRYIYPQRDQIWYFKTSRGYYVPFLFVNPGWSLQQTQYVFSDEAKEFIRLNTTMFPQLPKEITER